MAPAVARRISANTSLARRAKPVGHPSRVGECCQHFEVGPDAERRRHQPLPAQHPALKIGHRAALLGPLRDRQHDVSEFGCLGQERVADDEQVERAQPVGDAASSVGRRRQDWCP